MLPDDLKNYHGDGFQLVAPEVAGGIVGALVAVLLVLDVLNRFGWL